MNHLGACVMSVVLRWDLKLNTTATVLRNEWFPLVLWKQNGKVTEQLTNLLAAHGAFFLYFAKQKAYTVFESALTLTSAPVLSCPDDAIHP
jgi:hypothetical protein